MAPVFFELGIESLAAGSELNDWLGRIVGNYQQPKERFTPDEPLKMSQFVPPHAKSAPVTLNDIGANSGSDGGIDANAHVSKIVNTYLKTTNTHDVEFTSKTMQYYQLSNFDLIFGTMMDNGTIKKRLQDFLNDTGEAYIIIAAVVCTDPSFKEKYEAKKSAGLTVEIPLEAMGVPKLLADILDSDLGVKAEGNSHSNLDYNTAGSVIVAFQYRTIKRRIFSHAPVLSPKGPDIEQENKWLAEGRRHDDWVQPEDPELDLDIRDTDLTQLPDDDAGATVKTFEGFSFVGDVSK